MTEKIIIVSAPNKINPHVAKRIALAGATIVSAPVIMCPPRIEDIPETLLDNSLPRISMPKKMDTKTNSKTINQKEKNLQKGYIRTQINQRKYMACINGTKHK